MTTVAEQGQRELTTAERVALPGVQTSLRLAEAQARKTTLRRPSVIRG